MQELIINLYNAASGSSLFVIVEFSFVFFIIIMTYFAFHKTFSGGKPSVKFILSTLIGLSGYFTGKAVIIVWVVQPLLRQALHQSSVFY